MIKELIFDFDGTIADTYQVSIDILNKIRNIYGFEKITPKLAEASRDKGFRQIIKESKISSFKLPKIIKRTQKELNKQIGEIKIFEGMEDTLRNLAENGIKLGILSSNSKKNVNEFLEIKGLDCFEYVYNGMNLLGKSRLIKKILKKRNLKRNEAIYVGDEIRDIEACKKVGIKMVAVSWGFNSKEGLKKAKPNWLIDKPEEMMFLVKKGK